VSKTRADLKLAQVAVSKLVAGGQFSRLELFPTLGKQSAANGIRWHSEFLKRLLDSGLVERIGHPKGKPMYVASPGDALAKVDVAAFLWPGTANSSPLEQMPIEYDDVAGGLVEIEPEPESEPEVDSEAETEPGPEADLRIEEEAEQRAHEEVQQRQMNSELLAVFNHKIDQFITVLESMNDRIGTLGDRVEKLEARSPTTFPSNDVLAKLLSSHLDETLTRLMTTADRPPPAASPEFVKPEDAKEITDRLKLLTKEKGRSFLDKFKVSQSRFLLASDAKAAFEFLDELEGRKTPSRPDIVQALARIESKVSVELEEKIQGWLDDTDNEFVSKIANLEKKLVDKLDGGISLGGGFKTLVDALGDHRKLDKEDRDRLLQAIVQAFNTSTKQIREEISGTRSKIDQLEGRVKSKFDHLDGKLKRVDSIEKDVVAVMTGISRLLDQNETVFAALSKLIRLSGGDVGHSLTSQKSGLALISAVTAMPIADSGAKK